MGIYKLSTDEIMKSFEAFLRDQEGDVSAEIIAKAWNKLADKYGWKDRLVISS